MDEKDICSCYDEHEMHSYNIYDEKVATILYGICNGTRERESCTCGGDQSKCDFYPEKREAHQKTEDIDIKTYIKQKIKILKELHIRLTNAELEHLLSLETEIAVDNYAHSLICREDD